VEEQKLKAEVKNIVDDILKDYEKDRDIDIQNVNGQPDKDAVVDILNKIIHIIYPGYFRNKAYRIYTVRNNISMLLEDVIYNLSKQIALVLKYEPAFSGLDSDGISAKAEELTFAFLEKIPKIREYIETDVSEYPF
jgi:serine O-acetyltransferase